MLHMSAEDKALKKNKVCLGIDYGTTKTVVSYCTQDDDSPQLLLLGNNGSSNVPTCIYLPSADAVPLIGVQAEKRGRYDNLHFASDIKMQLTSDRFLLSVDGKEYSAADLTELYLKEIRKRCESYYQIANVVITHPAQGEPTRDDRLMKAVRNAGFQDVEFITEPEAAAYAYFKKNPGKFRNALVVDWGGGTLDMTLVAVDGHSTRTYPRFTCGWSQDLGGVDIDNVLFDHVEKLMTQQGKGAEWKADTLDYSWLVSIMDDIRGAKIALSDPTRSFVELSLKRATGEPYPAIKLKRADYIDLIHRDFLIDAAEKAAALIQEIKKANFTPEIILLFGGTSMIPEVAEYMCRETGLQCTPWSNAKQAVSLGAALKARETWLPPTTSKPRRKRWIMILLLSIMCVGGMIGVWYMRATELVDAVMLYGWGLSCYNDENYEEAVKYFRQAAEQGHVTAQLNLGICYEKGQGVPQNYTEAVAWYHKAAEQGDVNAKYRLGACYLEGKGVPIDRGMGIKLLHEATERTIDENLQKAREELEKIEKIEEKAIKRATPKYG